jgi:RNA polymerase sigma-70 factor, ECF subfamily
MIYRGSSHKERPFLDEKQAIAHLKQGDPRGLEALVYQYQLQALRAACLIVSDPALAEDIVQAAFIRAGERIGQFDSQRPFGPWFLRSVVNDALKAANGRKRFVSLDTLDCEDAPVLTDPAALPEELVEAEETVQAVWRAVSQLPPKQRAAIVLRYYLGLSEDEMTKELHGPQGTIKWWLYAARQRLKKLLEPLRPPEPPARSKNQARSDPNEESGDQP